MEKMFKNAGSGIAMLRRAKKFRVGVLKVLALEVAVKSVLRIFSVYNQNEFHSS